MISALFWPKKNAFRIKPMLGKHLAPLPSGFPSPSVFFVSIPALVDWNARHKVSWHCGPWKRQICGLSCDFQHLPLLRAELLAWSYNPGAGVRKSLLPLKSNQQQHPSQEEIRKPLLSLPEAVLVIPRWCTDRWKAQDWPRGSAEGWSRDSNVFPLYISPSCSLPAFPTRRTGWHVLNYINEVMSVCQSLWVQEDNMHFPIQTKLILFLLFDRIIVFGWSSKPQFFRKADKETNLPKLNHFSIKRVLLCFSFYFF